MSSVVFAHGSGSSRHSPRNRSVAARLQRAGFGTLLLDLLTAGEEELDLRGRELRFDIGLLARRLVERGVRFVQIYCGAGSQWDAHADIEGNHSKMCLRADRPSATLIKDLKARGLLDSTLVIWGGEFGRTPMTQGADGRDHNPFGFTVFLAGGGVKGGTAYGATDEYGYHAIENKVTVHDLHATMLHLMGIDHERLTFYHNGIQRRLTNVHGHVVRGILA